MSERTTGERSADLILYSDAVLTMGEAPAAAVDGLAVRDGRIVSVGTRLELEAWRGESSIVVDLGSRALLPGFIDVHAHAEVASRTLYATVDCRAPECSEIGHVLQRLYEGLTTYSRDGWLVGQGNLFFDQKLAEKRLPTRAELDSVSDKVAIALRAGGHITVLNTRALEEAGIGRGYEAPKHSITGRPDVELGTDGEPSGVVREFDNALPFPELDDVDLERALEEGIGRLFTANGVTRVGEISETVGGLQLIDRLIAERRLGVRMAVYLWAPGTMSADAACDWRTQLRLRCDERQFRIQGLKLFADGGYSAASAAVKRPYLDGHCGHIALEQVELARILERSAEAGLQLAVHANGDEAQEWVCRTIAQHGGAPAGALRTRVEHAGNFLPDYATTTAAWRDAGIIPVPQPVFLYTFGEFFSAYLGPYGDRGRFPFRRLLDDGWELTGSSDAWIGSEDDATNPLFSIWCCLARRTFLGRIIDVEQAIDIEEALRMHTINAARVLGVEEECGSLAVGKLADLVALDRDPRTVGIDELRQLKVETVWLEGRAVHQRTPAIHSSSAHLERA